MAQKVVWSDLAKLELASILEFYIEKNGNSIYSSKLLDQVDELVNLISQNYEIGRLTKNKITRVFPLYAFLLFYEINSDRIEIVSFWDNRQDEVRRKVK